jgi:DNA-binding LytR/AlgR family response regulator
MTPGEAEEKLQPDIFIRIHKSSLSTFRRLKKLIANK